MRYKGMKSLASKRVQVDVPLSFSAIPIIANYPLLQHEGKPALAIVKTGDRVEEGMLIAKATTQNSANIHSAIPGVVKSIEERVTLNGKKMPVIEIATGGRFKVQAPEGVRDYSHWSKQEILGELISKGVVELGEKVRPIQIHWGKHKEVKLLIVNAIDLEPYMANARRLLLEQLKAIISGIAIAVRVLEPQKIIIATNKTFSADAGQLLNELKTLTSVSVELFITPDIYPYQQEKLLIYKITGEKLGIGESADDHQIVISNVATFVASYEALALSKPLVERVVTIAGKGVVNPRNLIAKLGTPLGFLIEECGGFSQEKITLVADSALTGRMAVDLNTPLTKEIRAILALTPTETKPAAASACINCTMCRTKCPLNLSPREMYLGIEADRIDLSKNYGLEECIECGLCSFYCPARIELSHIFAYTKKHIKDQEDLQKSRNL